MNKIILVILFIPLISSICSSVSTTMLPTYQPGETMILEVQGNILEPIEKSDVVFKRNHVNIALDYDVKRILDKYYIYAQLPLTINNYTLFINDISTTVNGQNELIDYNQTFQVSGNVSEYSVSPGFIVTNKDFSLNMKSNLDQSTSININFPSERTVNLNPGSNIISFSIMGLSSGVYSASIGKYNVPIQIINQPNQNQSEPNVSVIITPRNIKETILSEEKKTYIFSIINLATRIESAYFDYNHDLFSIDKDTITLEENSSENISLTLKQTNQSILETIYLVLNNRPINNITLNIKFTENQSQVTNSSAPEYYCSELGGKFCAANEICSTTTTQTLDGSCCTSLCSIPKEKNYSWIVYVLIVVVIIILYFIYSRYSKSSLPKPSKPMPISPLLKRNI